MHLFYAKNSSSFNNFISKACDLKLFERNHDLPKVELTADDQCMIHEAIRTYSVNNGTDRTIHSDQTWKIENEHIIIYKVKFSRLENSVYYGRVYKFIVVKNDEAALFFRLWIDRYSEYLGPVSGFRSIGVERDVTY